MIPRAIRLLFVLLPAVACGQEASVRHSLRILPLGDPPPYRQEVRNGVRYEIPAAEGTIPPRTLEIGATAEEASKLRLRLGLVSAPLTFPPPESRSVEARRESGASWVRIPLANTAASLALVWRGGPDWNKARVLTVPDDAAERHRGDGRFINITAQPMAIVWGGERLKLNPRASLIRRLPDNAAAVEVSVLYPAADGELRPCLSTRIGRKPGTLHQFFIYAADEKNPRLPVKVLMLEEPR